MNIERLRKIMEYSDRNRDMMSSKVKDFCSLVEMSSDKDVLNVMQIARPAFRKMGYLVMEMPFADEEIGALCYKGDAFGYIVLNTSLPKVNVNFAIAHELYHVFYPKQEFRTKVEFINQQYYEHEEEFAANLFAGMFLMPESGFRFMYTKFQLESHKDEMDTVIRLMNYYQVPYMAVVIRCYELGLPDQYSALEKLLAADQNMIRKKFHELWLDDSILDATMKDDYTHIEEMVKYRGKECVDKAYLNQKTLEKVLRNMQTLYREIKGE